jgi:hypothetical protein
MTAKPPNPAWQGNASRQKKTSDKMPFPTHAEDNGREPPLSSDFSGILRIEKWFLGGFFGCESGIPSPTDSGSGDGAVVEMVNHVSQ